ncbi:MAG: hypothetical protein JKX85_08035, partial [Phycisphaeraceae bacterium]|nr:hypothetical protein [Phycisphaeraceae bacterium]
MIRKMHLGVTWLFLGIALFLGDGGMMCRVHAELLETGEPDNTIAAARPVTWDQPLTLKLVPRLDRDYFRLEILGPGVVSWTVKDWDAKAAGMNWPYVRIYDAQGKLLREGEWDAQVKAGVYYASICAARFESNIRVVKKPFTVTFHFE